MSNRVVITGLGLCSPLGNTVSAFWDNLLAGRSGIGAITLFDASAMPVRFGGEVRQLDLVELAAAFPEARSETDRKIWLGLAAVRQAIKDAALQSADLSWAYLLAGVSLESFSLELAAPAAHQEDWVRSLARRLLHTQAESRLQTPLDRLVQIAGVRYGIRGGRITNCSACAAGAQAIGEGLRRLRSGQAELAVAGAADSVLHPLGLGGFSLLRILSTENESPGKACRPFDATRQGTVLGEGAAFLVMETLSHARSRGVRIYAEALGYGTSLDAFRVTDPDPDGQGAIRSMKRALVDAEVSSEAIDGINAHGTGTPKNDVAETRAIKEAFGPRARSIPITANKSMTGHLIAASGALEAAASVLSLCHGRMPPTINLEQADPECDLDYVPGKARNFTGRVMLSNSFGFGGQNATLVFKQYEQ